MHWKEQLKAKIADAKNGSKRTLVIPGRYYRYVKLNVHCDLVNESSFGLWRRAIGHTNDLEFCGAGRGTLLLTDYQFTATGARFTFGLRDAWNSEFPVWSYFDFDSLP